MNAARTRTPPLARSESSNRHVACNSVVGLAIIIRKPFHAKANNKLELFMLTGEMCLWGSAIGNEMLLKEFNGVGNAWLT